MDGRKNNSGKIGNKGGGRRSLPLEHDIKELTANDIPNLIKSLVNLAYNAEKEADKLAAIKLLLAYYFGQPKQQTDIDVSDNTLKVIRETITRNGTED